MREATEAPQGLESRLKATHPTNGASKWHRSLVL